MKTAVIRGKNLRDVDAQLRITSIDADDPRFSDLIVGVDEWPTDVTKVVVLLGVPQHLGVERNGGRAGAADGPSAIRSALYRMATSEVAHRIAQRDLAIVDLGDLITEGKTLEQIHDEQHDIVNAILSEGALPIVLGGGHDTAWPTIMALNSYGKTYSALNIDAHADVRPLKDGGRAHSGSPFRQMIEAKGALAQGAFVEFGLQKYAVAAAHADYVRNNGGHIEWLDEIRHDGFDVAWERTWPVLRATSNVYVSLDMDGFASAFAPGVSAPSADGFTPWEVQEVLRHVAQSSHLIAFDVVETNPTFDVDGRTAKLAAAMIAAVIGSLRQNRD